MTSHSSATMREATPHENEARTNNILRTVRFFVTLWRHTIRGLLDSCDKRMRAKALRIHSTSHKHAKCEDPKSKQKNCKQTKPVRTT